MSEITLHNQNLPANIEDLTNFVLIGREKLASVRAQIRAIDKIGIANNVRHQKEIEAQGLASALLDAETKIGELLKNIEPSHGGSIDNKKGGSKKSLPEGITHKQSHYFQAMADNKDVVEQVKAEAKEKEKLPTRQEVLTKIKEKKKEVEKGQKKEKYIKASEAFKNDDIKIFIEDFRTGAKSISDNSIDAIITDPPYPIEYINLWEDMFLIADRILKPSAFLVTYANHQNLDKIFQLNNPLKYYWCFKLDFTSKPIAMGRNLIATWKPVLVYQKMPFKKIETTIEDCVKETKKFVYNERDMHDKNWAQSIGKFEYLIDVFTSPGDTIFEPFAGTGTTLCAAKNMKRKCIGYEIDKKYEKIIKGRIINEE